VLEQALHVCETTVVQDAWDRGQELSVHAWIYELRDGRLFDLEFTVGAAGEVGGMYEAAVRGLTSGGDSAREANQASAERDQ
jgi:carbonic anhydrase